MSDEDLFDQASAAQVDQGQAAQDFLMGEGVASATFPKIGHVVKGDVLSVELRDQTEYGTGAVKRYDDGNVAKQLVVTVQTEDREDIVNSKTGKIRTAAEDDDGKRAIYIKGQMKAATRDAVKAAGARGIEIGGYLAVKFDDTKPSGKGNPIKVYKVAYKTPAQVQAGTATPDAKAAGGTMDQIKAAKAKAAAQAAAEQGEPPF
jgi:hypothetical protein